MPGQDSAVDVEPGAPVTSPSAWTREVWRRKLLVLLVLVATVLAAVAAWAVTPRTYSASAAVKVSSGGINEGVQSSAQASTLLATQVEVLQSTQLANEVATRLDGAVDIVSTDVQGVPESQVATVTVVATTAAGAARAANEFVLTYQDRRNRGVVEEATERAEILQDQIDQVSALLNDAQEDLDEESQRVNLEQARITIARDNATRAGIVLGPEDVVLPNTSRLNALQAAYSDLASQLSALRTEQQGYETAAAAGNGGVAIVSVAQEPSAPSTPGLAQTVALAGVLGLGLGVGLALLLGLRDRRLHDVGAVQRAVPVRVLAAVGRDERAAPAAVSAGGVLLPAPDGRLVDAYVEVALGVVAQWPEPIRTLLVCSPSRSEEQLAAPGALAVALARLGRHVVLVDARGPQTDGGHDPVGPHDVQPGGVDLAESMLSVDVSGAGSLHVLPAGPARAAHVGEAGLREVLATLSGGDGVVVVHGPPLNSSAASVTLGPDVDGVLLPVLLGATRGPDLASACDRLDAVGGRVLGVVAHHQVVRVTAGAAGNDTQAWISRMEDQPEETTDRSVSSSSLS